MFFLWLIFVVIVISFWLLNISQKRHKYWQERGVSHAATLPFFGNAAWAITKGLSLPEMFRKIYDSFPTKRYCGFYQFLTPVLVIRDPDLIKQILVKDFDHFTDHWTEVSEKHEPIWARTIVALKGLKWRIMRGILSPMFTSRKMRAMFVDSMKYTELLTENVKKNFKCYSKCDTKDLALRFSNDIMAITAFGVKCDSIKQENNELYKTSLEAFGFESHWKNFKFFLVLMVPRLAQIFRLSIFSSNVRNFFQQFVNDIMQTRTEQNIIREDLIHLLMEVKKGKLTRYEEIQDGVNEGFATAEESELTKSSLSEKKTEFSEYDLIAQALVFHFAGFDTIAIVVSFLVHEITINKDVQEKLQKEIDQVHAGKRGDVTYEDIMKMKYLDMTICEILRKYPPAPSLDRKCVKKYTMPAIKPDERPVELNIGDQIWVPVSGIHWDEEYYPNPSKFDPERFSDENTHNIAPYTYIPFGVGPRNCIGSRFALMQMKIFAYNFYLTFNTFPISKTQVPLKISKKHVVLHAEKGTWVGLEVR